VLILDEPTRGIDIAAKQELMNEILELANGGTAVLFISAEIEEVVARPRIASWCCAIAAQSRRAAAQAPTKDAVYGMIAAR